MNDNFNDWCQKTVCKQNQTALLFNSSFTHSCRCYLEVVELKKSLIAMKI